MRPYRALLMILILAVAGCATTASDGERSNRDPYRISAEEIADATQENVYDLVRALRPRWEGVAYLDGYRLGPMTRLADVSVSSVRRIEYLSRVDARARFGLEHGEGGAILVRTR